MDRPRRIPEDGRTMLPKAQDLKKSRNLETGITQKTSFAFKSNEDLLLNASSVNITFGNDTKMVNDKLKSLKDKELGDRTAFEENNLEVNLLGNLDIEMVVEEFPPLSKFGMVPLKDVSGVDPGSWVKVASKSCEDNSNNSSNDRNILECERP